MTLDEWLKTVHRGNQLDRMTGLIRNTQIKPISYKDHIARLLSNEQAEDIELPTFLDGSDFGNTVAYTSYSRSGNTFFRRYLE